jgi:hypothetical protein
MNNIPPNTIKPFPEGASSIYQAGIQHNNNSINKQMSLINTTGGKKYKRGGSVTLPPFSVPYTDVGAGNNTTTANYRNGIQTTLQSNADSKYDVCVGQGPSCTLLQNAGSKRRHTNKRKRSLNNKRKRTNKGKRTNKRKRTNKKRYTKHK